MTETLPERDLFSVEPFQGFAGSKGIAAGRIDLERLSIVPGGAFDGAELLGEPPCLDEHDDILAARGTNPSRERRLE